MASRDLPTANEFHLAFGLGADDGTIAPADMAGVALAAAKALDARVIAPTGEAGPAARRRVERLERRNKRLTRRMVRLERQVKALLASGNDRGTSG